VYNIVCWLLGYKELDAAQAQWHNTIYSSEGAAWMRKIRRAQQFFGVYLWWNVGNLVLRGAGLRLFNVINGCNSRLYIWTIIWLYISYITSQSWDRGPCNREMYPLVIRTAPPSRSCWKAWNSKGCGERWFEWLWLWGKIQRAYKSLPVYVTRM